MANRRDLTERNLEAQRKRNAKVAQQIRDLRQRQGALERTMRSLLGRVVLHPGRRRR